MKDGKNNNNDHIIKEFIQKRGFNIRKFYLYPDKVIIESKTLRKIEKYEIKIDTIGFDTFYEADNILVGKIVFIICIVAPIFMTILRLFPGQSISNVNLVISYIFCWGFALINCLKQHQDDIFLKGQQNLVFYRNYPSEQEVIEFINLIVSTSKNYLKKKYFRFDDYTAENEFKNTMRWLLDKEIISVSEFDKIKNEFHVKKLL